MTMRVCAFFAAAMTFAALGAPAAAHHGQVGLFDEARVVGGARDVRGREEGRAAELLDLANRLLAVCAAGREIVDEHGGALASERQRSRAPDASGGSGHEPALAFHQTGHPVNLSRSARSGGRAP